MYETYKNQVVSNFASLDINLNEEQINNILTSMDRAADNFNFYEKRISNNLNKDGNGIPFLVYDYINCKHSEGLSDQTIYGYKIVLELFFKNCTKELNEIEPEDIRDFLTYYQQVSNITNRSLDKYREYILRFFTWLHEMGIINRNPGYACKPIKYEQTQREALNNYELELFRNACETDREKAIVEVLYSTACRVSELIILKITDIDWITGSVHIFGKGAKHRTSFLNARAKVALDNYIRNRRGNSEYIFISERSPYGPLTKEAVEKIIRNIASRVENLNKHVTPHVIRHTTATMALHNGMSINEISTFLGHSNIETTMIYARTSYDDVKQAHDKYIL